MSPEPSTTNARISLETIHRHPLTGRRPPVDGPSVRRLSRLIRLTGQVAPVAVRPSPAHAGHFELLAGEPRWSAAVVAKLPKIPALVCDNLELDDTLETFERLARDHNRNPIQTANALRALHTLIHGADHHDLARLAGWSRNTVTHYLLLLRLPAAVRTYLEEGRLSFGHGKALCSRRLARDPARQLHLAREAVRHAWSVRHTEVAVADAAGHRIGGADLVDDPNITRLAETLSGLTGLRATIEHEASGKGRYIFEYNSLEESENLLRFFPHG